ncbi:2-hydroxychromene-2-carboxylate isomerase [Cognatiyoonia sp. IB215182]|uniref:2-hydroxychromene-2-carboxylate isomerase n=1 Tax=Cognatiyoonia sp. IB215182 TaxID=3097353 RepID=UPI002A0AB00E|nr:2-hydroxychromene-2-carboxylate isomerase [Cognatiyoonia sp. IB215182]MDX8355229.1 2-hydroxychromene-2-carboxylate isomerase [Cognatiyoonia sp. IB215182]
MKIEVWFEFASTYSYLTVSRVEEVTQRAGVEMEWKPFLLGPIFQAKGWETSPFVLDPVKGDYMWRDMERRAERLGIPFSRPPVFPAHSLLAARVMTAALGEPWRSGFARDVFRAQFASGEDISQEVVLHRILMAYTSNPGQWIELAQSDGVKSELRANTDQAAEIGIFGAPSFRVGNELFWGDDRLGDAVDWLKSNLYSQ